METSTASTPAITHYVDETVPALEYVAWPIPKEQWEQFVDADALVTFTAAVPLDTLMTEGPQGLKHYVEQAFDHQVTVCSPEFRVVGHIQPDEFDEPFIGDVVLQVSCQLISKE